MLSPAPLVQIKMLSNIEIIGINSKFPKIGISFSQIYPIKSKIKFSGCFYSTLYIKNKEKTIHTPHKIKVTLINHQKI